MRGTFDGQGRLFSSISPEHRGAARYPLQTIHELVREVLRELDRDFRTRYSTTGHASIKPEQLLSARLRHVLHRFATHTYNDRVYCGMGQAAGDQV